MAFRCVSCGIDFDSAEEFMAHKQSHQAPPVEKPRKGLLCLMCGTPIPLEPSQANYVGEMRCPSCGQIMKVRLEDGEVLFASSRASQT
jgi:DNA-directed RNA polymerase subunit RPC12/RpoP